MSLFQGLKAPFPARVHRFLLQAGGRNLKNVARRRSTERYTKRVRSVAKAHTTITQTHSQRMMQQTIDDGVYYGQFS